MKFVCFLAALLFAAHAQDQRTPAANASVSGTVKDAITGKPLAGYNVSTFVHGVWLNDMIIQNRDTFQAQAVTDAQGRYRLSDLPPDIYRIEVRSREFGSNLERRITVAGHDLEGVDFSLKVDGIISGRVLDENKDPVPDMSVWLISREYYYGQLGYFFKGAGKTNDRGEYSIPRVQAGHPYLLMAEKVERTIPAHSDVPLDPKLRRRTPRRTFYPGAPDREGGAIVSVRPGEHREGVDIELKKSPNYCAEGVLSGSSGPASVSFGITAMQPSDGQSSSGGLMTAIPSGTSGPDGKFRVCNLSPGAYRLTAYEPRVGENSELTMGAHALVPIVITDQDVKNVRVTLTPGIRVEGEVVLDGPVPAKPITARAGVSIQPLLRSNLPGEMYNSRVGIAGTFSFDGLVLGDYAVSSYMTARGYYIKDITSAGNSVMYGSVRVGASPDGAGLRIVVGNDGATLNAAVSDKDGNPQADMQVLVLPREITSEAML